MSTSPRPPLSAGLFGVLALAGLVTLLAVADSKIERLLRTEWFDAYQRVMPRERQSDPVVIVQIDERSLALLGQWPWPRTRLAGLIEQIASAAPAAIAIDALFPEPDGYSQHALTLTLGLDPAEAARLSQTLPDPDPAFARALEKAPVILGIGGIHDTPTAVAAAVATPLLQKGGHALDFVPNYTGVQRSLAVIDKAAKGHGALNAEAERGIYRRLPTLIGTHDGNLYPSLAIETLRFLGGGAPLQATLSKQGMRALEVAGLRIPTARNGEWWLHFSNWQERLHYSAADVLRGAVDSEVFRGRVVLIGYTALGLADIVATPLGRMPGVDVHAEALDNALTGRLLSRPPILEARELLALIILGALAIVGCVYWRPWQATLLFACACTVLAGFGVFAFSHWGWLFDAANPIAFAALIFVATMTVALGEAQTQRRQLRRELVMSREHQARVQGELNAARRIQLGMLPPAERFAAEPRLAIGCAMTPAKAVGGDFFDFFMLDKDRLFLVVGDVSGKGLPSALFMALAKAYLRGAAQRAAGPGETLSLANQSLAQDNPELLFITVFAAELNLAHGLLRWSNAGHDSPYCKTEQSLVTPFAATGPPLCALDDFSYPSQEYELTRGARLCAITDGVSEARNARGELFGNERIRACLTAAAPSADAASIITLLTRDLEAFVGDTEQADDITLLCVEWRGEPCG